MLRRCPSSVNPPASKDGAPSKPSALLLNAYPSVGTPQPFSSSRPLSFSSWNTMTAYRKAALGEVLDRGGEAANAVVEPDHDRPGVGADPVDAHFQIRRCRDAVLAFGCPDWQRDSKQGYGSYRDQEAPCTREKSRPWPYRLQPCPSATAAPILILFEDHLHHEFAADLVHQAVLLSGSLGGFAPHGPSVDPAVIGFRQDDRLGLGRQPSRTLRRKSYFDVSASTHSMHDGRRHRKTGKNATLAEPLFQCVQALQDFTDEYLRYIRALRWRPMMSHTA
jgi:hypothetical protein